MKAASLSDKPTQNNGNEEQMRKKVTKQPKTCIPLDQAQGCSPKPMDAYGRRGVIYKEGGGDRGNDSTGGGGDYGSGGSEGRVVTRLVAEVKEG
ncbi:hypothetical protein WN944_026199 [Citrus x changshan-huyou]|uniref:Uncharacterized protein n=1 Tax=Citrus x changshan-huyou TaxID=2935761 RepID=A0AAP0QEB9_9ROSI